MLDFRKTSAFGGQTEERKELIDNLMLMGGVTKEVATITVDAGIEITDAAFATVSERLDNVAEPQRANAYSLVMFLLTNRGEAALTLNALEKVARLRRESVRH